MQTACYCVCPPASLPLPQVTLIHHNSPPTEPQCVHPEALCIHPLPCVSPLVCVLPLTLVVHHMHGQSLVPPVSVPTARTRPPLVDHHDNDACSAPSHTSRAPSTCPGPHLHIPAPSTRPVPIYASSHHPRIPAPTLMVCAATCQPSMFYSPTLTGHPPSTCCPPSALYVPLFVPALSVRPFMPSTMDRASSPPLCTLQCALAPSLRVSTHLCCHTQPWHQGT